MEKMKAISRGRGLGSLMMRGDTWYLRYQVNGCPKLASLFTADLEEAKVKAEDVFRPVVAVSQDQGASRRPCRRSQGVDQSRNS